MNESEIAALVGRARLEVSPVVAETMRSAGSHDDRLGAGRVTHAARLAVAVWLQAVEGDDTALAAMAEPVATHWLMHPVRKNWQVAPGPAVTQIRIWELEAGASPPRLSLSFQFTGHRPFADPSLADRSPADPSPADPSLADGIAAEETVFAGLLSLVRQRTGPCRGGWFPAMSRRWMSSSATRSAARRPRRIRGAHRLARSAAGRRAGTAGPAVPADGRLLRA